MIGGIIRYRYSRIKDTVVYSLMTLACASTAPACQTHEKVPFNSEPSSEHYEVVVIGAGAAGLAAANRLNDADVNFRILEATETYGGRVQKNDDFADFSIDLGAEWIHADKSVLNELLGVSESSLNVETILYQPMDIYTLDETGLTQWSDAELNMFYNNYIVEYKFKSTTWYDYLKNNFASNVDENILYNMTVTEVDTTSELVQVSTETGEVFTADKVILTVSPGVLKSGSISFLPDLSMEKQAAIDAIRFKVGFKMLLKFNEKFYPDMIIHDSGIANDEKIYYDMAYNKDASDHVLGLLVTGGAAEAYYDLGDERSIVAAILDELDPFYDGAPSLHYTGEYLYKDWGRPVTTLGTWTTGGASSETHDVLTAPIDNKVYFAGETFKVNDPLYLRGSVHGAILSGYAAADAILAGE